MNKPYFIFIVSGFWLLQDESFNFFSGDERYIECQDTSVLEWLQNKIETVMILNMEEKSCPSELWSAYLNVEENCLFLHMYVCITIICADMYIQVWFSHHLTGLICMTCLFLRKLEYVGSLWGWVDKNYYSVCRLTTLLSCWSKVISLHHWTFFSDLTLLVETLSFMRFDIFMAAGGQVAVFGFLIWYIIISGCSYAEYKGSVFLWNVRNHINSTRLHCVTTQKAVIWTFYHATEHGTLLSSVKYFHGREWTYKRLSEAVFLI